MIAAICPFLVDAAGAWRSASPAREHRCGATDPPGRVPLDQQQRLCLTTAHLDCPLFEAAAGLTVGPHLQEAARAAADLDPKAVPAALAIAQRNDDAAADPPAFVESRRPIPRTAPVILDRARPPIDLHLPKLRMPDLRHRGPSISGGPGLPAPQTRIERLRAARMEARSAADAAAEATVWASTSRGDPPVRGVDRMERAVASGVSGGSGDAGSHGPASGGGPSGGSGGTASGSGPGTQSGGASGGSGGAGSGGRASGGGPSGGSGGTASGSSGGWRGRFRPGGPGGDNDKLGDSIGDSPNGAPDPEPPAREPSSVPDLARGRRTRSDAPPSAATPLARPPGPSGPRRFTPPGGPGGFRTLGRVGGSRGGESGLRAALAGREIQAALAGLLGLALVLVLVVRFSGGGTAGVAGASSSSRPSAGTSARASGAPPSGAAPSGAPASGPVPSAIPGRTPAATRPVATARSTAKPTQTPAGARTYRVKPGDTLSAIAARFGTTVAALMRLNNITDPRSLRVGQILKLP